MNQTTMLEYENQIAGYLKNSNNHVRYRVTPLFRGQELVCRGVQMEAQVLKTKGFVSMFLSITCLITLRSII